MRSKNILIVEDDLDVAAILKSIVPAEFTVIWAKDMEEAAWHLTTNQFFLIVTDFNFPGGDGAQVLNTAKCNQLPSTEIILHSSDFEATEKHGASFDATYGKLDKALIKLLKDSKQLAVLS